MKVHAKIATCFVLLICAAVSTAHAQPVFYGVNCGCPEPFVSPGGEFFAADQPYNPGDGYGFTGGYPPEPGFFEIIGGTEGWEPAEIIFNTRREGDFSYRFDVPPGNYAVTLYLVELTFHGPGFRVFNIEIEGIPRVWDLDICAEVGKAYVLPLRFHVNCSDGQLNINFVPLLEGGTLSAVSVQSISPDGYPPDPVEGFSLINGYEMNILDWIPDSEEDLKGYNVYRREPGGSWELLTPDSHPLSRYLDWDAVPGVTFEYQVAAVDFWGNESSPSEVLSAASLPQESAQLPIYVMEISDENLYTLNADIWSDDYVDADLTLEGSSYPGSGVRYRGNVTRHLSKKNYKLNLPSGILHEGRDKLNCQAEMMDPTLLKDRLAYDTYDLLGCLNPSHQNVHMILNGRYIGVYLDLEQVDDHFLEARGLSTAGNLYKCESDLAILPTYEDYQAHYSKENNENTTWDDIIEFIEWLNNSTYQEFHDEAGEKFDLDGYLDAYCVLITTADMDFPFHNYYMYNNPVDQRWYFVFWDHNSTFSTAQSPIDLGTEESPSPIGDSWNKLLDKVLEDSLFRYAYCKKLERFLDGSFSIAQAQTMINAAYSEIYDDAVRDVYKFGWEDSGPFEGGPSDLASFVQQRVPFLQGEIPQFISSPDLSPYFRLNEIQADNQSTVTDEAGDYDPWLEIFNAAAVELDLEGFTLEVNGSSWTLPSEAVVDAESFLIFWLDGEPGEGPLHAPFALTTSGGLVQLRAPTGSFSDSVTCPPLSADQVWARLTDGSGDWVDYLVPTPGSTNNPYENPSELVINEFLAINTNTNPDPAGEYDDWVEIYNPTDSTISLTGLYLTDDLSRPTKWAFPDTAIAAGSYLLIWTDDDPEQGALHATFKLDGDGEQIGLYDRDGVTPIDTLTFGAQTEDISYGRYPDGGDTWYQLTPTPEGANQPLSNVVVSLTPLNPPIVIPESGGSFEFNIAVENVSSVPQTFDLWMDITLPSGGSVSVLTVTGLTIPGSTTIDRDRTQVVPDYAPAGEYTYNAYVGTYPWVVNHQDSFTFTKTGSDPWSSVGNDEDWINTGEGFDAWLTENTSTTPTNFRLRGCYPNPFNPTTVIGFDLPQAAKVTVEVFDVNGRLIWEWARHAVSLQAGVHEISFDGSGLASGIYIYRLNAGEFEASGKMVLMK